MHCAGRRHLTALVDDIALLAPDTNVRLVNVKQSGQFEASMQHINSLLSVGKNWSAEPLERGSGSDPHPTLRVVTLNDPIFLSTELQPNGSYKYGGYLYELWKMVAREANLNYSIVPIEARNFGNLDTNGTWTGLVGELAYGRADVALASLDMRLDRASVIDYLDASPVDQSHAGFYVHLGRQETPQLYGLLSSLLKSLDANVWWTLLGFVLAMSVMLRIFLYFNRDRTENRQTVEELPWTTCLLSCFMSMVGQGWTTVPNSLSARMVTISCWTLGIVISVSYTTNLISHLTIVMTDELPINTLAEFSERSDWKFAIAVGSGKLNEWRYSSNVHELALYNRYATGKGFIALNFTSKASAMTILKEGVLTYVDFHYLQAVFGSDACLLAPLPGIPRQSTLTFMAVSKRMNRLRRHINLLLLKMETRGVISRLRRRWRLANDVVCESSSSYRALSLSHTLAILAVLPLSMCTSIVLLLLERAFSFYNIKSSLQAVNSFIKKFRQ